MSSFALKQFLKRWILPPGITDAYRLLNQPTPAPRLRKEWSGTPIDAKHHQSRFFKKNHVKKVVELFRENRLAIEASDTEEITFKRESHETMLQIGFGSIRTSGNVQIAINNKTVANIAGYPIGQWNDVRFLLSDFPAKETLTLRINVKSRSRFYISNPLLLKQRQAQPKNIVCILLDGVSYSMISDKSLCPNIDSFFAKGFHCSQAYSQNNWTLPTLSSMITGYYPSRHGVYNPDTHERGLPQSIKTLSEVLNQAGYRTFMASTHTRFSPAYDHSRGVERFLYVPANPRLGSYKDVLHESVLHLEAHKDDSNFLLLHLFGTHPPYFPSSILRQINEPAFRNYDDLALLKFPEAKRENYNDNLKRAKLREIDAMLQPFFAYLENHPGFANTTVILTADHALEYNVDSKSILWSGRTHVPLIVRTPLCDTRIKSDQLIESSVDFAPSILKLAGIEETIGEDGKVWSFLSGEEKTEVFSESLHKTEYEAAIRDRNSVTFFRTGFNHASGEIDFENFLSVLSFKKKSDDETLLEEIVLSDGDKRKKIEHLRNKYHAKPRLWLQQH